MKIIKRLQQQLAQLTGALGRMVAVGEVSSLDPAGHRVKVVLPGHDNVVTDFLPVLTRRALGMSNSALPKIGEQVWCLFIPLAGLEKGCVIGSSFNAEDTPPSSNPQQIYWRFADGTTFYYDEQKSECKLNMPQGTLEITVPNTTINSNVQINGTLGTTGNIHSDQDISDNTRTMAADRDIHNDHIHPNGTPNTGKTAQRQ